MPRYEYRCRQCTSVFEMTRPMAESSTPATCPDGHRDSVRLLSAVALTGVGAGAARSAPAPAAGGCCGGGCGCG